eukprot:148534-Amphidinium_carterae.1
METDGQSEEHADGPRNRKHHKHDKRSKHCEHDGKHDDRTASIIVDLGAAVIVKKLLSVTLKFDSNLGTAGILKQLMSVQVEIDIRLLAAGIGKKLLTVTMNFDLGAAGIVKRLLMSMFPSARQ